MRLLARRDGGRGGGHRLGASLEKGHTEGTSCTSPVYVWCYNHNGKFLLYQRSPFPLWEKGMFRGPLVTLVFVFV